MIGYFVVGYLTINWLTQERTSFVDASVAADHLIPFVPAFIFGYILVYGSILLIYLTIDDEADWHRVVVSLFAITTLSYLFFVIVPVRMEMRPDLSGHTGFFVAVTRFYYSIDLPHNCFPSLHVAYPTLATLVAWRNHNRMRWVFAMMTAIVAVSVVLVKQHYLSDVAAGFANAGLCFWLTVKLEPVWSKWFDRR